jgi:hypothetical protein
MRSPIIALVVVASAGIASAQTPPPAGVVTRKPAEPETRTTDLSFVVNGFIGDDGGAPLPGVRLAYRPVGSPLAFHVALNTLVVASQLEAGLEVRLSKSRTTPYLFGRGGVFYAVIPGPFGGEVAAPTIAGGAGISVASKGGFLFFLEGGVEKGEKEPFAIVAVGLGKRF